MRIFCLTLLIVIGCSSSSEEKWAKGRDYIYTLDDDDTMWGNIGIDKPICIRLRVFPPYYWKYDNCDDPQPIGVSSPRRITGQVPGDPEYDEFSVILVKNKKAVFHAVLYDKDHNTARKFRMYLRP
jgi:hypothetical protein